MKILSLLIQSVKHEMETLDSCVQNNYHFYLKYHKPTHLDLLVKQEEEILDYKNILWWLIFLNGGKS